MAAEQAKMNDAKNMALLFFMDHLMQKNGRRTIHDLSCQFGARGFSQDMRDAVGATQEGLTDFLRQHPSLFTVDGNQVVLKGFGEVDGKNQLMKMPVGGRQRDYAAEAVDFFVAKLEKFGPELQIKSLLGHRSQAAPEVRLVSGRHLREFYEFLESQKDFIVEGDRVRLANIPEPQITDESGILDDEGRPLAGMKAKQAAVDFLKSVLQQNENTLIPLDTFYKRFCERFPHSVRQDVATNPKELLQFLKLNRNIFFMRSNKVSLVRARDGEDGALAEVDGSRSTASPDSTAGSPPTQSYVDASWEMFSLNRDNLDRVHLVKALKTAQVIVGNILNDINVNNNNGQANNSSNGNNNNIETPTEKFVCVDFKLVTLGGPFHVVPGSGTTGAEEFLSMICVATPHRVVVFDLAHSDSILLESGLNELLENVNVLKVIHDVKRVATLLAQHYAINMRNVFDTQIAHMIIQHEKFNKPLSELHPISFINLQRVYFPQSLMLSDVTPRKLSQTPNWSQRPISDELLLTASEECHCLMRELYRNVCVKLPATHKQLFETKCVEALTPLPTRPPPQLPIGLLRVGIGVPGAVKFGGGLLPPPLVPPTLFMSPAAMARDAGNVDSTAFNNGIYRPPACRRIEGGIGVPPLNGFSPAMSCRKASASTNGGTGSELLAGGFTSYMRSNSNNDGMGIMTPQFCQQCNCHQRVGLPPAAPQVVLQPPEPVIQQKIKPKPKMVDSTTQTASTGEITSLKTYNEAQDGMTEKS